MKSAEIAGLLRLVMYDVLGLICPGAIFLYLITRYTQKVEAFAEVTSQLQLDTTLHVAVVVFVSYILGYLLQGISYYHSSFFSPIGKRALGKPQSKADPRDPGVSPSGRFTRTYNEQSAFYKAVRDRIAKEVDVDAAKLTYSDTSSLAFSFAGDEATLARDFRFRSDLCGAVSTLALLNAVLFIPALSCKQSSTSWSWFAIPCSVLIFVFFTRFVCKGPKAVESESKKGAMHTAREWLFTHALWMALLCACAMGLSSWLLIQHWAVKPEWWWVAPLSVLAWLILLLRSFFYGDIGGRIIFPIALVHIVDRKQTEKPKNN